MTRSEITPNANNILTDHLDGRTAGRMPEKLIVSLLPGATEMVAAIGGLTQLVGVSHECDWPLEIRSLPKVTATPIDGNGSSAEIHRAVQGAVAAGRHVIEIDADVLRKLGPDVIITQQLCDVCAVSGGAIFGITAILDQSPEVVVLSGTTLAGVWDDIRRIGTAIGRQREAVDLATRLAGEVTALAAAPLARRPRVVAIEWLDPLFLAGHWVPEMIATAGGEDIGATAGRHSVIRDWDDVMAFDPELVFVVLCGFDEARARSELTRVADPDFRRWLRERTVVVLDGNAYTSRPGPRLMDGVRLMREAIREAVAKSQITRSAPLT